MATTVVGGGLGGLAWSVVGLGWPAAVVGGLNGLVGGLRRTYDWRSRRGALALLLDSTWGAPMTVAALAAHGVALLSPGRGRYVEAMSERQNRHVYAGGLRIRKRFVVALGNTINNAGDVVVQSLRRQQLVRDHEDVHVWQARWFGPLYPILYIGWTIVGGAVGGVVWLARRPQGASLPRVVEAYGYYLNPFEWWAYSRDGSWPPPGMVPGLGWRRPIVRPVSARTTHPARRARRAGPG